MIPLACFAAIVLLMDVSGSVSDAAFQAQRDGTASAFEDPQVLRVIEASGGIAVQVSQFDIASDTRLGWRMIPDGAAARDFAASLRAMPRRTRGNPTAIGRALNHAHAALAEAPCLPTTRVIDISTDGYETDARPPARHARDAAALEGVVINAIAFSSYDGVRQGEDWIHVVQQETQDWLSENVATGFVRVANDPAGFHEAFRSKVVFEITRLDTNGHLR